MNRTRRLSTSPSFPPAGKYPREEMSFEVSERFAGVTVRLDQSLRNNRPKHRARLAKSVTDPDIATPGLAIAVSQLPPAVANVPAEDLRGYAHSKKVYNYFVGSTLGEGSFAKVKEAFNILVGEKVAMKVIDKKKALQDAYVAKNFKREARLLQKVRHPNIVQLYEVIETENNYYLITELCTGGELMKHIYKHRHLSEEETRKYIRQIVSAVDHLHRAGILHRDLKVENLLLDHNMDIKLIDFGLSNEEYIRDSESGEEQHCRTQCGSPAYAAPELLGQKEYDKSVDVWSIGVNMYAMLTGALPYTVEPFNITALHAKMLQNKMNPIPSHLTDSCKDLLRRMLVTNPERRITMAEVFQHPWLSEKHVFPFQPAPYPNHIAQVDINEDIVEHMVTLLKVDTAHAIKQDLLTNKATSNSAIYHLLSARLARYKREVKDNAPVVRQRRRHGSKKISRDQGYYEGDDDAMSVATMPSLSSRKGKRTINVGGTEVLLRTHTSQKPRPNSDLIPDDTPRRHRNNYTQLSSIREDRRRSLPHDNLLEDFQKTYLNHRARPNGVYTTLPTYTQQKTKKMSQPSDPVEWDLQSIDQPLPSTTVHAPTHPPSRQRRKSRSIPSYLEQMAWQSSEPSSLDNSRHNLVSNTPSGTSNELDVDEMFDSSHQVTFSLDSPNVSSGHLPRLYPPKNPQTRPRRQTSPAGMRLPSDSPTKGRAKVTQSPSHTRPARKLSPSCGDYHLKTDLPTCAVISELLRVAEKMRMKSAELTEERDKLRCRHNHMSFEVSVTKASRFDASCKLHFEWVSGGDLKLFQDICQEVLQRIMV